MLILFDVDATLISTSASGIGAIRDAGVEAFGPGFTTDRTAFAGRLDPLILRDVLRDNGIEPLPAAVSRLREGYRRWLATRLAVAGVARALPGVPALLNALSAGGGVTLGLLTGNFPETGRLKLVASGVDPDRFAVQVWGDESPHDPPDRAHLPPLGIARYAAATGRTIAPEQVTIVGDTIHDVACGRANGCRVLAVATGSFSEDTLAAAGADRVVPDLSRTAELVSWLTRSAG